MHIASSGCCECALKHIYGTQRVAGGRACQCCTPEWLAQTALGPKLHWLAVRPAGMGGGGKGAELGGGRAGLGLTVVFSTGSYPLPGHVA